MNWDISISKAENLVVVKTRGAFSFEQIKAMTIETFRKALDNDIGNILGDHRDLDSQVSIVEIYNLPRELLRNIVNRHTKVAVVYSKASSKKEDFDFFETTALNVGVNVKLFVDLDEARLWLKER